MHDDVTGVDQHPVTRTFAFHPDIAQIGSLYFFFEMLSHRTDLPRRAAARDNHVVGEGCFSCEIYDDNIFCLVVVKLTLYEPAQPLRSRIVRR